MNCEVSYNLKASGYSLFEILIALLVLSIGILNIAKIQTTALIHNYNAYLYSLATEQIATIFERLQAGPNNQELITWKQNVAAALPQGHGKYNQNTRTISVCWFDRFAHTTTCLKELLEEI
jgi:type IV pilus assembly protein PilV